MAKKSKIKHDILTRVRFLYLLFMVVGIAMVLRIFYIQLISEEVSINAEKIHGRIFSHQSVRAHRGSILSRSGEPFATSILRYQVEMDFGSEGFDSLKTFHRQSDSLSKLLSAYFKDRSVAQYQKLFRDSRTKNYQLIYKKDTLVRRSEGWFDTFLDMLHGEKMKNVKLYDTIRIHRPVKLFPREIDYSEWQILREYPILNWNMGMTYNLVDRDERIYAQGDMANRTIGKIMEDRGKDYGIEEIYNDVLSGQDGQVLRQRIARGFYGRVVGGESREAVDGMDVVTTLDVELQDIATRALREHLTVQNAIWGTAIVMEVETGEILALANLDQMSDGSFKEWRNRAIGARAEPGSTFKLASAMALLEVGHMPTSQIYNSEDGRRVKVGKTSVQDSHSGYSEVDLRTAFAQSLNVYFTRAVYNTFKDDPMVYSNFLRHLQLDKTVGLDAFGEPQPLLPVQGDKAGWYPHITLVNQGYGYGVEITPMRTLTLYNSVANNGKMVAPKLVKEIRKDGKVVERFGTEVLVDNVCSKSTLDTLQSFLREVCVTGTGKGYLGKFEGFNVSAKTGTAQYAQDGYSHRDGYYLASMVGYMPTEKPKYSVMTMIHTRRGRGNTIYGAGLAGPVMQKIMQRLYNIEHDWHTRLDTIPENSYPTQIKGGKISSIQKVASTLTPHHTKGDSGDGWGTTEFNKDTNAITITEKELVDGSMPNVYGMGLRDALFLLESRGLRVTFKGTGKVYSQSIKTGSKINRGNAVTIQLK
ncbi:MAG: penicillin-binding protein [Rikenellaceae bacterium]